MADNTVEFKIGVDASAAIAGTRNAIKEIEKTIQSLKTSTRSDDTKLLALGEEFKTAKTEARKLKKEVSVLTEDFERKFAKATPAIQQVVNKLIDLRQQISESSSPEEQTKLTNLFNTYKGQLSSLEARYNKTNHTTLGLAGKEGALTKYLDENDKLLTQQEKLNSLKEQYLAREKEIAQETQETSGAEQSVSDAAEAATQAARENAEATQEAADATTNLKTATDDIGKTATPQEKPREEIGKTVKPGAPTDIKQVTTETEKAAEEAKKTAEVFAELDTKINAAFNYAPAMNNIAGLIKHLRDLQAAQRAIENANMPEQYQGAYNQIYNEIERTKSAINEYRQSLNGVSETHKKAEQTGVGFGKKVVGAFGALKKAGSGISSLLKSIKSGFKSLDKHTGKVKSSFDGMARNMKSNFKHLLRNVTKYVFGFRSLFFLVRRLRRYLKEGIENIVKYESAVGQSKRLDSTNQALNKLRTSLLFLQNAWAAAFQPVIMIASKILSPFIDMLARAGNAVARFLGVLTGQKTVYQAVKTPAKDYAKSLKNAGSGAGKAAKKQKQLNDRIAEFDDLILLGRDKDPNDGVGTGGGGGNADDDYDYGKMFKKVKAFSKLADMIKKAWKTGDFTDVGKWFSDKIIKALDKINDPKNLEKAKKTATKFGKSVATFFNGLFSDTSIWTKMGQALANGVNIIFKALEGFLANNETDWGGGLAKAINGFFSNIDWPSIKNTIKLFGEQLSANITSFLNELNWDDIQKACSNIGEMIKTFIDNTLKDKELMKALGKTVGEFVNSLAELIGNLFSGDGDSGTDFGAELIGKKDTANSLGEAFATLLMTALKTIKWGKVAKTLETVLGSLFTNISDFFNTEEGSKVLDDIIEAFSNVDWAGLAIKGINAALAVGKAFTEVAAKISNAISEAIINADPEELSQAIADFIGQINVEDLVESTMLILEAIVKSLIASGCLTQLIPAIFKGIFTAINESLKENSIEIDWNGLGEYIVAGLLGGIGYALTNVAQWIVDNVFTPIKDAITGKDAFDMGSPSKVAEEWGGWIMEGLLNGVVSLVESVTKKFGEIKDTIETTFVTAKDNVIATVNTLVSNVGLSWDDMLFSASTKFTQIKDKIITVWEEIKNGIKEPINGILSIVEKMVNKVIGGINSMIDKLDSMPSWDITNPFNGKKYKMGFNIPKLATVSIPKLAQGAVIPPNREFMAVLGDQSSGTNIEAPLDTIKQAVAEVMANNGNQEMIQLLQELITVVQNKNLVIGDKEIGKATARYNNQQRIIRGTSF